MPDKWFERITLEDIEFYLTEKSMNGCSSGLPLYPAHIINKYDKERIRKKVAIEENLHPNSIRYLLKDCLYCGHPRLKRILSHVLLFKNQ